MGSYGLRTHIWNNRVRTVLLLAGFPVLLVIVCFGFALLVAAFDNPRIEEGFGLAVEVMPVLIPIAVALSLVWWGIAFFAHQGIIAGATGSRELDRRSEPRVWNLLENLCISRGITMPKLRIIETPARNAFASGIREKHYAITVTRGLVDALDDAELEAVLAHELTHIQNRDVQLIVVAAIFVGIISLAGDLIVRTPWTMMRASRGLRGRSSSGGKGGGGVVILILIAIAIFLLARLMAIGLRFAVSRRREYLADAGAVELTKNPDAMISALRQISGHSEIPSPQQLKPMFIDLPKATGFMGLFATHPPIDARIKALIEFAGGRDLPVTETMSAEQAPRPWG